MRELIYSGVVILYAMNVSAICLLCNKLCTILFEVAIEKRDSSYRCFWEIIVFGGRLISNRLKCPMN